MRKLFAVICCFTLFWTLRARERDRFDEALDRYEAICDRCLDLRAVLEQGGGLPESELRSLLDQVSTLRRTLQGASGQMTAEQRARFDAIRTRFQTGGRRRAALLPPVEIEPDPALQPVQGRLKVQPLQLNGYQSGAPVHPHPFLLFSAGLHAAPEAGLMAGALYGRGGAYLRGRSRFVRQEIGYDCRSDRTADYGWVWLSGRRKFPAYQVTAGGLVRVSPGLHLYAGAGYGSRQVLWEDVDGTWARVSDLSVDGWAFETGILFTYKYFALSAGVGTLAFRTLCPEIGIGVCF